jgi:hypothetical protein
MDVTFANSGTSPVVLTRLSIFMYYAEYGEGDSADGLSAYDAAPVHVAAKYTVDLSPYNQNERYLTNKEFNPRNQWTGTDLTPPLKIKATGVGRVELTFVRGGGPIDGEVGGDDLSTLMHWYRMKLRFEFARVDGQSEQDTVMVESDIFALSF